MVVLLRDDLPLDFAAIHVRCCRIRLLLPHIVRFNVLCVNSYERDNSDNIRIGERQEQHPPVKCVIQQHLGLFQLAQL